MAVLMLSGTSVLAKLTAQVSALLGPGKAHSPGLCPPGHKDVGFPWGCVGTAAHWLCTLPEGKGVGGWHPVVCPPQPWGGALGCFQGRRAKPAHGGGCSTARQEEHRAQQCHQPLSRAGLRGTDRGDSTGRGKLAWDQHRALAGHPEEASSDKHNCCTFQAVEVDGATPKMESWEDLEGLTAPCHLPPAQRWLKAWEEPHPCSLGAQVSLRSVRNKGAE